MFEGATALFLAKLIPIFVYPLGFAILLAFAGALGIILKLWRSAAWSIGSALVLLWVCSTPIFADWALGTLERQYPSRAISDTPVAEVAIVLGGVIGQPLRPRVVADLSGAADRILHAARLYRAGKITRVLVSAGNLQWSDYATSEAVLIRELLMEWGVPTEAIEIADASRNTYENALEIKQIWVRSGFKSALLVTSAAHMPRAMGVFLHAGLPVIAATTDVRVVDRLSTSLLDLLPAADDLAMTTEAMKEWIGYWAYRARGYL
jgi:uncharacterized SAM-binding protein YcdF (DUF218 family)